MIKSYTTCKGCGARIFYVKTMNGNRMPLNPDEITFTPAGGPDTFVTMDGKVERGKRSQDGQTGYLSHFATCPMANRFRNVKRARREED